MLASQVVTSPDVSVIMTGHREGRLMHRSVRSARRAMEYARDHGITTELVAVLDSPDPPTRDYVMGREELFTRIEEVGYRDLGLSRNHGVDVATGRFVCFLDADDLFSENWLTAAFQFASQRPTERLVLHPELNLYFGRELFLMRHRDCLDPRFDPLDLLESNLWTALSFTSRDAFLDGPGYAPMNLVRGFGYEDWHWNCEMLAGGAVHRCVPRTVHFIRMKAGGSLVQHSRQAGVVIRPTALFDDGRLDECRRRISMLRDTQTTCEDGNEKVADWALIRRLFTHGSALFAGWSIHRPLKALQNRMDRWHPRIGRLVSEVLTAARRAQPPGRLPEWLLEQWRTIHEVEPQLFPSPRALKRLGCVAPRKSVIGARYPALRSACGVSPTHVLLVARWEDHQPVHAALASMELISRENPSSRAVLIVTEGRHIDRDRALPDDARFVLLNDLARDCLPREKEQLLLKLLIQTGPSVIHNLDSPTGHRLLGSYGPALSAQSRLFASIYCEGVMQDGRLHGSAIEHLPQYVSSLTHLFFDSGILLRRFCDCYALEEDQCSAVELSGPGGGTADRKAWAELFKRVRGYVFDDVSGERRHRHRPRAVGEGVQRRCGVRERTSSAPK